MTTRSNSERDNKVEEEVSLSTVAIPNEEDSKDEDALEDNSKSMQDVDSKSIPICKKEEIDINPTSSSSPQTDDAPTQTKPRQDSEKMDSKTNNDDPNSESIENDENDLIPFAHNMNTEAMTAAANYPFSFSHNLIPTSAANNNNSSSSSNPPTRRLSFEDDNQPFGLSASPPHKKVTFDKDNKPRDFTNVTTNNASSDHSLTCQEDQDFGSPPAPVGLDSIFPTTYMDEMSSFPTLQQNQYLIDDSYSNNLLGCAFIPSPRQDPETSSLSNSNLVLSSTSLNPFSLNINDIRAQYSGPTLSNTFSNHSSQPMMSSLPSLDGHGYNDTNEIGNIQDENEEDKNNGFKSTGKTLLNLSQISASVDRSSRTKRPRTRKMSRNLPLRKRHPSLATNSRGTSDQNDIDGMTTPINTTRQTNTRHLVSRSASTEKKKKSIHTKQLKRHRKVSGRKPYPRTATTSDGRFKLLPKAENVGDGMTRVIQHFVPKRHTVPILSTERTLPNTVIFG